MTLTIQVFASKQGELTNQVWSDDAAKAHPTVGPTEVLPEIGPPLLRVTLSGDQ